jgi:DNA repair exonuclease SbcCD ATPase subunit
MRLTIKELSLVNFRGLTISISFSANTLILGMNGIGKTRVNDAFLWLLFGKDTQGRQDYEIKPRDQDMRNSKVSVRGMFDLDGQELTLERIYSEKWTKKKGSEEAEFSGNVTEYSINGVACNATNFKTKINSILDEDRFKLITSSSYFNTLKWQDKRNLLIQAAGEPSEEEIIGDNEDFKRLLSYCTGKTMDEYRKEIAAKKKPIKKELDEIPARIDEARQGIIDKDWISLEGIIKDRETMIEELERRIADENLRVQEENKDVNSKIQALYNEIASLERRKMDIENRYKASYQKESNDIESEKERTRREIAGIEDEINRLEKGITDNTKAKERVSDILSKLGAQYEAVLSGKVEGDNRICPTCGQEFTEKFLHDRKAHLLEDINKKGEENDAHLRSYDQMISEYENKITALNARRTELSSNLDILDRRVIKHFVSAYTEDEEHKDVIKDIDQKKEDIDLLSGSVVTSNDLSPVKDQISKIRKKIEEIKGELSGKIHSDKAKARVDELETRQKDLAVSLARYEKTEMIADRFIHKKMDMMEERINSLFRMVKWKMYEQQINGGEKECCECYINGVPFGVQNTATKVNAGLDIALAFSRIYDVYAPVFLDNRESVTELIDADTQVVSLIVSPEHQELTIKNQ